MINKLLSIQFFRFCLVGLVGFLVDATILHALVSMEGFSNIVARSLSFLPAVTTTWILNRYFSFKRQKSHSICKEWLKYLSVNFIGAAINLGIFIGLIYSLAFLANKPVFALAIASILALLVNYLGSKFYVFHKSNKVISHT